MVGRTLIFVKSPVRLASETPVSKEKFQRDVHRIAFPSAFSAAESISRVFPVEGETFSASMWKASESSCLSSAAEGSVFDWSFKNMNSLSADSKIASNF